VATVLKLVPSKSDTAQVVELLEKLLEDAKAGRCSAAIVIADYGQTSKMNTAGYAKNYDVVAALEAHKVLFIREEILGE
jgi:hypothetical protein